MQILAEGVVVGKKSRTQERVQLAKYRYRVRYRDALGDNDGALSGRVGDSYPESG